MAILRSLRFLSKASFDSAVADFRREMRALGLHETKIARAQYIWCAIPQIFKPLAQGFFVPCLSVCFPNMKLRPFWGHAPPLPFPTSLPDFMRLFPDDTACAAHLERVRWPGGLCLPALRVAGRTLPLPESLFRGAALSPVPTRYVAYCPHGHPTGA